MNLQKKQTVRVHQIAMELLTKTKESPFVAILILAKELDRINAELLKEHLFSNLPLGACRNLLIRLELQGYLKPKQLTFGLLVTQKDDFELTDKGYESAADKSMWVGEKGIYNVYTTETPFTEQIIISIEPVKNNAADDRNINAQYVFRKLANYENKEIALKNTMYRIEKMDNKCFELPKENWTLQLNAKPKEQVELTIKSENKTENSTAFREEMFFDFDDLKANILNEEFGDSFDNNNLSIPFDAQNLNFIRDVEIRKPKFSDEVFEAIQLKDIKHRPETEQDASDWYAYILGNNINKYFLSDDDFYNHSIAHAQLFQPYFDLNTIKRTELIGLLEDKSVFYQRAKLETIDFLNY